MDVPSPPTEETPLERSEFPLLELGILGGAVSSPDYPSASRSRLRGLGFPNFRYRGKLFRSEENEGTRARLIGHPIYKLDFSFGLNFPVDSNSSDVRRGMPDLDFIGELGPRFKVRLRPESRDWQKIELVFPFRAAIMSNFKYFQDRGFTFTPGIQWGHKDIFCPRCQLFARVSAMFADERYQEIFYEVAPQYVTANRPYYDAKSGFMGWQLFTGYVLRIQKFQAFLGMNYNRYDGATNHPSPLFQQNYNYTYILGLGWLFWQSQEKGYK